MMSYDVLEKQNHHLQLNIFQFEIKKKKHYAYSCFRGRVPRAGYQN